MVTLDLLAVFVVLIDGPEAYKEEQDDVDQHPVPELDVRDFHRTAQALDYIDHNGYVLKHDLHPQEDRPELACLGKHVRCL